MISYAKLAALAAAMALGAALCVWTYATPRIAGLQRQIAEIQAADATATATFQTQARAREKELQDAADKAQAGYVAAQAETGRRIASLDADGKRLRNQIAAYASSNAFKLPATGQALPGVDGPASTLGLLLSDCIDLSAARAGDAEKLADQVRGLQALMQ